jgi:hypothetical protein
MTRFHLSSLLGLSLFLTAAAAQAAPDTRFVIHGSTADVDAEVSDDCTSTVFFVGGQDNVLREGGPATPSQAAFLSYWTYDRCAGVTTMGVGSNWEDATFSASFQGASLGSTFVVDNFSIPDDPSGDFLEWTTTAVVSVGWTGTGRVTPSNDGFNIKIGNLLWTSSVRSQTRAASVALDVTIDGVPASFDTVSGELGQVGWSMLILRRPW